MKMNFSMKRVFFILILSLCLLFSCTVKTNSNVSGTSETEDKITISVSGSGVVNVEADMVTFSVEVSETAETTGEAQQKTNKKISQLLSIFRSNNIDEKDITTSSLSFSTAYHWDNNIRVKDGEMVSQTLRVRLKDIDNFGNIADEIGSSVSGIYLSNVTFGAQDKSEAIVKARELAYEDALKKAQTYAKSANLTLDAPISISEGSTSTSSNRDYSAALLLVKSADENASYSTETPTGVLSVTVNTSIVFKAH